MNFDSALQNTSHVWKLAISIYFHCENALLFLKRIPSFENIKFSFSEAVDDEVAVQHTDDGLFVPNPAPQSNLRHSPSEFQKWWCSWQELSWCHALSALVLKSLDHLAMSAEDLEPVTPESWSSQLANFSVDPCQRSQIRCFGLAKLSQTLTLQIFATFPEPAKTMEFGSGAC